MCFNFILKKKFKKYIVLFYYYYNLNKKFNIFKYNMLFFYNFLYKHLNILNLVYKYKNQNRLDSILLINFKNKQVKLNLIDLILKKKFIFTIGLVLKFLNLYKKSNRRNTLFLKYLISYVIKKYSQSLQNQKIMFVIKGLIKNYMKLLYYFKSIISNFNISIMYLNPIKIFNNINIKRKRSIKRRIFKKLVDFNKI